MKPVTKTQNFRQLIVWPKAHQLVLAVYKVAGSFPKEGVYVLTSQLKRASISVAANTAEGYKKKTAGSKLNYLNIAEGSLEEIKYFFISLATLCICPEKESQALTEKAEEVGRLIHGYAEGIKNDS